MKKKVSKMLSKILLTTAHDFAKQKKSQYVHVAENL